MRKRGPPRSFRATAMSPPLVQVLQHLRRLTGAHGPDCDSDAALLERFGRRQDEDAFAILVSRHGPMVLRLCRRVLGNDHSAEDVFQAVFLVLARKAAGLR